MGRRAARSDVHPAAVRRSPSVRISKSFCRRLHRENLEPSTKRFRDSDRRGAPNSRASGARQWGAPVGRASVAAREAIPAPTGSRWVFLPRSLRIAQTRSEEGIESHLFSRANHFPSGRAVALTFLPSPATRTHPNSVVKRVFANPAGFFLPRSLRIAQTHTFQLAGNTRFTTLFGRVRVAGIPYTFPISVLFNLTLS